MGIEDPTIYTLLPLFEEGIGPDRVSDMTIAILRDKFFAYTSRKAKELNIPTSVFCNKITGECVALPRYKNKFILLIPASILSDLPIADDPSDIDSVSGYNSNLRRCICKEIGITLKEYSEMHKSELKKKLFSDSERLESILAKVTGARFLSYDFTNDDKLVYMPILLKENIVDNYPVTLPKLEENNVLDVVNTLCETFKHLIESNRMSKLLFPHNQSVDESYVQRLFYFMSILYCEVNNVDINRETNPGCGELDFKFSSGAHKKVIIEIKLSSSSQLQHGLTVQLPIYMEMENVDDGIYMVLRMSETDDGAISSLKKVYAEIPESTSKPQLIIIDAVPRPSASKA